MTGARHLLVAGLLVAAGCAGTEDVNQEPSQLDVTIRNERADPIDVNVTVVDADGETVSTENGTVDPGVSRVFNVGAESVGEYEVTVNGEDWSADFRWNSDECAHHESTVRVTNESVESQGECIEPRSPTDQGLQPPRRAPPP